MSIIGTENIDRFGILVLFFLHIIYRFAALGPFELLLGNSSFDLHWNFFIFLSKLSYLFLDLGMHLELFQAAISYPAIDLLEEMNILVFGNWFNGS